MAKKRDILSNYFNGFNNFKQTYLTRLNELKRDFNNEKYEYDKLLLKIEQEYSQEHEKHLCVFLEEENENKKLIDTIKQDYNERFEQIQLDLQKNENDNLLEIENENILYQEIQDQFEERKQEALTRYLDLIKDSNRLIDESVEVHVNFINDQNEQNKSLKDYYQDINSFLANDLLNTMEKAKNALNSLNENLKYSNLSDSKELNQTVLKSLELLRGTQNSTISIFKENTKNLEEERDRIRKISRTKQKPHSEMNQEMIQDYVNQIRNVQKNKVEFEAQVKNDLTSSLAKLYPRIIKAEEENNNEDLKKYIYQKEIIEKKADYLLKRSETLSSFTIRKYQQEIKKIKIDSFKRSEEIKLAYSLPIAFLQNSVDVYSNFAFYLNQSFDELDRLLNSLVDFHQEFLDIKTNFINSTSKAYEDYKINLIVRINHITENLTKLISRIDDVSLQIVTLESKNRLDIAEVKKRIENLEITGDYNKYLASLENDQFFAIYQHKINLDKIKNSKNYKINLLDINKNVLELHQNTELNQVHLQNVINSSKNELNIHERYFDMLLEEYDTFFTQQNKLAFILSNIAKLEITNNIKTTNYYYAKKYFEIKKSHDKDDSLRSIAVVDYVHHIQKLIDINNSSTKSLSDYLKISENDMSYLTIVEKNRLSLHRQIDELAFNKHKICYEAASLYIHEMTDLNNQFNDVLSTYLVKLKQLLLFNEYQTINHEAKIVQSKGYINNISSLITYMTNLTLKLAYKHQVPKIIEDLSVNYETTLNIINDLSLKTFTKLKPKSNQKKYHYLVESYLIETINIINSYYSHITESLENIRDSITKNDLEVIAKSRIEAKKHHDIIDKEYDKLAYEAINIKNKRKKEIQKLYDNSQSYNENFKQQVKDLNSMYLKISHDSQKFLNYLEKSINKNILENDRRLLVLLNLIDEDIVVTRENFEKIHNSNIESINKIKENLKITYDEEVKFIHDLTFTRDEEVKNTINLLEQRINELPEEKSKKISIIKEEKILLYEEKRKELLNRLKEIEANKMLSKPELLKEIENIENNLSNEYVNLYHNIQELESEFLQQFTLINEDYLENYQDYISKQTANRLILEDKSKVYSGFDRLNKYHQDLDTIFQINYKEIMNISSTSRSNVKSEKQKSKDKQDRIINA